MIEEIFRRDPYQKQCRAQITGTVHDGFFVDQTVFYPTGGGQPGDHGTAIGDDGVEYHIVDTIYHENGQGICHCIAPGNSLPRKGDAIKLCIDWRRRYKLMRMHSCMHLLCAVIPAEVTGGSIHEDRGRLDFNLPAPIDKREVTEKLNHLILQDAEREFIWISPESLAAQPDLVRTMSVKPPMSGDQVRLVKFGDVDMQACGGTHVAHAAEIGRVEVAKIEKKGKLNRRVSVVFVE